MGRFLHLPSPDEAPDEDPLSGVANIFDVAVVFIVGLMIALFSVYRIGDLIDPNSEVTLVKTDADGLREIIVKRGTEITAYELTGETLGGGGGRAPGHGVSPRQWSDHLCAGLVGRSSSRC